MCGVTGFLRTGSKPAVDGERLRRMIAALEHRGPDALRGVIESGVALGHTRLAIVDVEGGQQPMRDPLSGVVVVFNGEIFNHVELRAELAGGYAFRTRSDTEVLLAAFLRWGSACVERFNGQFAFAAWEPRSKELTLARDPMGICPLFIARDAAGGLAFASEAKALIAGNFVDGSLDDDGVVQALTLWAPLAPRTALKGVESLRPGAVVRVRPGRTQMSTTFEPLPVERDMHRSRASWAEELLATLDDAVALRLRADVPVAAYLSGGLDSSVVCALAQRRLQGTLRTFSVGFAEAAFDEREHQNHVVRKLETRHKSIEIRGEDIGAVLPAVVRHAEQPLVRTAPAPFFCLSRMVSDDGVRVVLTGEGADEFLLGYDLYREAKVRAFWARQPSSTLRPRLLRRLYPYLRLASQGDAVLTQFFRSGLDDVDAPAFSHRARFAAGARIGRFLSPSFRERLQRNPIVDVEAAMPDAVRSGTVLERALWLEVRVLLGGYLLSAQGDRMLLGNAVEGRFPFLDPRVVKLALSMPERVRLSALNEKRVLKDAAVGLVPPEVLQRKKFPNRAPVASAIAVRCATDSGDDVVSEVLSPRALRDAGVFDEHKTAGLIEKLASSSMASEADAMALIGIASTQLLGREMKSFVDTRNPAEARVEILL
ncbi:MAG: asparagine synthase (glutamine-hydrolyzing) [Deltaproteobacteria bacterium]|nr:asparagine synthase (glutamine-hydrolyzing) [Deltaproteobacteria bacterium]